MGQPKANSLDDPKSGLTNIYVKTKSCYLVMNQSWVNASPTSDYHISLKREYN